MSVCVCHQNTPGDLDADQQPVDVRGRSRQGAVTVAAPLHCRLIHGVVLQNAPGHAAASCFDLSLNVCGHA